VQALPLSEKTEQPETGEEEYSSSTFPVSSMEVDCA
jgi:hypothetical protein